ncbi:hypothetical protein NC651_018558 [Populus alba x Populus x berolinensis]|nr:hypothetical protein NC651_018558 [Populus alba x Populus x berolinensis]
MEDTDYLERGMDVEEWEHDDSVLPPPPLLVEEVRDHKCGFPVTYTCFPCHPLEDRCDGGDDNCRTPKKIHNIAGPTGENFLFIFIWFFGVAT